MIVGCLMADHLPGKVEAAPEADMIFSRSTSLKCLGIVYSLY